MKFDTIIIGGGLSGMVAGITLAKRGQKCLLVAAGQSSLHFFAGSMELLGGEGSPIDAIATLAPEHPYAKLGAAKVATYAEMVKPLFSEMGISLVGDTKQNHYRVTPVGLLKPAWLTVEEYATGTAEGRLSAWKKVALVSAKGFMDFNMSFVASNLAKEGVAVVPAEVATPELEHLRSNPSEMRSTNIAKALVDDALQAFAHAVKDAINADVDAVLLPAMFGINDDAAVKALQAAINKPVRLIATMPPSVPGIRIQTALRRKFQALGGTFMLGDAVVSGKIEGNKLVSINTENHGDMAFEADNFILATGGFVTHGLASTRDGIFEPVLGLDVDCPADRSTWTTSNLFDDQPFMHFGVATDQALHAKKDGKVIANLYATGSVLSGFNKVKGGCATGVSLITGLHAANQILK